MIPEKARVQIDARRIPPAWCRSGSIVNGVVQGADGEAEALGIRRGCGGIVAALGAALSDRLEILGWAIRRASADRLGCPAERPCRFERDVIRAE